MRNFKQVLSSLFIFAFAAFVMAGSVLAAEKEAKGKVMTSSNDFAVGASVTAECNGTTLNDTTDSNGDFSITFPDGICNSGDAVTVSASLNGESATEVTNAGNGPIVNFNVMNLLAIAVPEFGLITGIVAAGGSALAYFKMKKGMA